MYVTDTNVVICRDRVGLVWRRGGRGRGAFAPISFAPEFGPELEDEVTEHDGRDIPDLADSSAGEDDLSWVD